jgi:multimeric flavodoxin WrbA
VVLFTPITFGGYSSTLKKALDHWIPLLLPFFRSFHGETHHPLRYARRMRVLALGVLPQADAESEDIFRRLVQRNARNLGDAPHATIVATAGDGQERLRADLARGLAELEVTP